MPDRALWLSDLYHAAQAVYPFTQPIRTRLKGYLPYQHILKHNPIP